MRFYFQKIGEHFQELALLAMVFVPLDRTLATRSLLLIEGACVVMLFIGIETERRAR